MVYFFCNIQYCYSWASLSLLTRCFIYKKMNFRQKKWSKNIKQFQHVANDNIFIIFLELLGICHAPFPRVVIWPQINHRKNGKLQ